MSEYHPSQFYVTQMVNERAVRQVATSKLERGITSTIHFHSAEDPCSDHDHEEIT